MPPTLLVVDDDPVTTDHFARGLRAHGYRVLEAYSGQEGIDRARATRPDAVILDLHMAAMDGVDMLEQIRNVVGLRVPAVVITGERPDAVFNERLQRLGATIRFKPIWIDDLIDIAHELLPEEQDAPTPGHGVCPLDSATC